MDIIRCTPVHQIGTKINLRGTSMSRVPLRRKGANWLSLGGKEAGPWLGLVLASFLFCLPLFSQTSQGTIQGAVLDQSGGAIAGAAVTVTDVARGISRNLVADGAGQYIAVDVTPGSYTVRAEVKGFKTEEHSGILVEVGQTIRIDIVMQPGEQTQTVTVSGEVPAINTTDATLGGTVSNLEVNALPLNGRNFDRLLQLRPGIVTSVGGGSANGPQTNGRRNTDDQLRLDGIAGMAQAQGSDILNATYTIQEFNTVENPTAEYGFRDGGFVNVGVKSGTNAIHGTAYAFGRDAAATDAPNYFTGKVNPVTLEQFGATAGGPILKDKLFWFAGYEGLRLAYGDPSQVALPVDVCAADCGGTVSTFNAAAAAKSNNMIDVCNFEKSAAPGVNPLSAQLSGLGNFATGSAGNCTVANPSGFGTATENVFPYSTTGTLNPPLTTASPLNNGLFKADYNVGTHNHFSGLYFISRSTALANSQTQQLVPEWEVNVFNDVHQYDGTWTWTPSSNWVNDVRWGLVYMNNQRAYADQNLPADSPWPSGYGFNTGVTNPLYGGFPYIQISSLPTMELGAGPRSSIRGPEGDSDLIESVSYLHGKHAFKFGFEYVDVILDGDTYTGAQGAATFQSLATWITGVPTKASILTGDPTEEARSHWYGIYAEDSWRVAPRVTLNLGLRWEYYGALSVRDNYWGNFNPNASSTTPAFEQFGSGEPLPSLYKPQLRDFSPRVGVAWDVFGNGKTVVRAGGGVLRNGALEKSFLGASAPFGATFFGGTAASPVLIGPNNSGTAVSAHSSVTDSLACPGQCNSSATSVPGEINWNLAGPVFPSVGAQKINGVTYTGQLCAPTGVATGPCSVAAVDPNFLDPYSIQWNLDIQRAITNNLTLSVAYVGNHGADEMSQVDLNQPPLGTGWNTPTSTLPAASQLPGGVSPAAYCLASMSSNYSNCGASKTVQAAVSALATAAGQYRSIFPYLGTIYEVTNGEISNYDALQVTVQGRNYHGLSFLSSYTYGHALSESDADVEGGTGVAPDKSNLRLLYGNSAGDLRNRFTFSPSYNIPGIKSPAQMLQGWSVSGILVLQGGAPWSPNDTSSTDYLGTGELGTGTTQTWNYLGKPSAFKVTPNPIPCWGSAPGCATFASNAAATAQCQAAATEPYGGATTTNGQLALAALANSSCYIENGGVLTPPAYGTYGDAYNGIFRGSPYYNIDLSIAKIWKIKERYSAQFRAEFFNLFNRADWAASGSGGGTSTAAGNPTGSNFGVATSTPDATNPVTGGGGPRHIQFGLKLAF
jgi:Carboxypeptidase regulatory-like domain